MQTSIERGNERVETQRALNYEKKKRKEKFYVQFLQKWHHRNNKAIQQNGFVYIHTHYPYTYRRTYMHTWIHTTKKREESRANEFNINFDKYFYKIIVGAWIVIPHTYKKKKKKKKWGKKRKKKS